MLQNCQLDGWALNGRLVGLTLNKCQAGPGAERWTSQGCRWTSGSLGL